MIRRGTGRIRFDPSASAGFNWLARRFAGSRSKKVVVLLYHRITERSHDPWGLSVTERNFSQHLEVLQRYRCLSMPQLTAAIEAGKLPRRAVVVTFDDGYADNLLNAKPLLEQHDIPATVFVASGYLDHPRGFWWDDLETIFLRPGRLPTSLSLSVGQKTCEWDLSDAAECTEADCDQHRRWRAWSEPTTTRQRVYQSVYELLHPLSHDARQPLILQLLSWARHGDQASADNRVLSSSELGALACGGLVGIGCHTRTHPRLSSLSRDTQRAEITESKVRLEELLGRPVMSFAYPYGRTSDYTNETMAIVRATGFSCAFAAEGGPICDDANSFQLPRQQASDVNGDVFDAQLREWFRA